MFHCSIICTVCIWCVGMYQGKSNACSEFIPIYGRDQQYGQEVSYPGMLFSHEYEMVFLQCYKHEMSTCSLVCFLLLLLISSQ